MAASWILLPIQSDDLLCGRFQTNSFEIQRANVTKILVRQKQCCMNNFEITDCSSIMLPVFRAVDYLLNECKRLTKLKNEFKIADFGLILNQLFINVN